MSKIKRKHRSMGSIGMRASERERKEKRIKSFIGFKCEIVCDFQNDLAAMNHISYTVHFAVLTRKHEIIVRERARQTHGHIMYISSGIEWAQSIRTHSE